MKELEIDIETKSDRDIVKCGVYAYADSPHFAVTLFSVSVDGGVVQLYDLTAGDEIPSEILNALVDECIIKRAFNVQFERVCLSKYLRVHYPEIFSSYSIDEDTVHDYLSPRSWQCTMIHARYLGLPSSLAQVGEVLKLQQQKMTEGKALIKFFCVPYDYENGTPLFTILLIIPKSGSFSRNIISVMWKRNWKSTDDFQNIPFPITSGKNFISTRRLTIEVLRWIWNL